MITLPKIPDEDTDFTPDLARKIIEKYQAMVALYHGALTIIASYDDKFGNRGLENIGTYSGFDEPASVKIAREALALPSTHHETTK